MKKASSSFLVLFVAALFWSVQSFAQSAELISERIQQSMRTQERLRLSEVLRLSPQEQRQMEIISLSVMAQSFQGPSSFNVLLAGRPLSGPHAVKKQLKETMIRFPAKTKLEGLELQSAGEIFIESITAEVRRVRVQGPSPIPTPLPQYEQQPAPQSFLTLQIHQDIRGRGEIPLRSLVKEQYGLSLEGVQIERVVVTGLPLMYGRAASVQVELNNRLVGPMKYLSAARKRTPLLLNSFEPVRTLRLVVQDARIQEISIRIGQVSPFRY